MTRRLLLAATLAALLGGCASVPPPPGCVKLGPDGLVCLLAPAVLPAIDASHLVTVTRNGERHTFLGRLRVDSRTLRLAAASLFGTGLFTISYDGRRVRSQPAALHLDPELVVAMLEMSIADPAALRGRLHNLTLKVSHAGHAHVRELFEHGRLVVRIERSDAPLADARIRIEIPLAKTSLVLTPVAR